MNYLPIIIIVLFMLMKKNDNYKNLFSSFNMDEIFSLLPLLGIDEQMAKSIAGILPLLTGENIDMATLIKTLAPLFLSTANKNSSKKDEMVYDSTFSDIKGIANSEIIDGLNKYFS